MKRLIPLMLALALLGGLIPALAEGLSLPAGCVEIARDQSVSVDLDGDGVLERVRWSYDPEYNDEDLALIVEPASGSALVYGTDIMDSEAVYVMDLDSDGLPEILLTGDFMSSDYFTWCLQYRNGRLTDVLFPDGNRGENTDGYFTQGYGLITRLTDSAIELTGTQDVLGTWMASRVVFLDSTNRFEFCDNGLWERYDSDYESEADLWEYAALTAKAPIPYIGEHGWDDGILNPGDRLLVYATDKRSEAHFVTPDDITGILSISPKYEQSWGWLVDGVPEEDCFELVPYGD